MKNLNTTTANYETILDLKEENPQMFAFKMVAELQLTHHEVKVITALCDDDFFQDSGETWIEGFAEDNDINPRSFSGILSSLVKKGFVQTNGEYFGLTQDFFSNF